MTASSNPPLVLLVEDHADLREMYATYLELSGCRVAQASDGAEALASARELMPDAVVMDLTLPTLDGWEATRRLKQDARTAHIPIIATTGHTSRGQLDAAREAGCEAILIKPCMPDALVAEVRRVLAARA